MMSVPSASWNVALDCSRPFRSSAQLWGIEKFQVSKALSDLAADSDQVGAAVSALPCTVGDRESRKNLFVGRHHML